MNDVAAVNATVLCDLHIAFVSVYDDFYFTLKFCFHILRPAPSQPPFILVLKQTEILSIVLFIFLKREICDAFLCYIARIVFWRNESRRFKFAIFFSNNFHYISVYSFDTT